MTNKQFKNGNQRLSSGKDDVQIINDLIENRKHQMDALIKIMESIDLTGEVAPHPETPSKNTLSDMKKKVFKRRTEK